MYSSVHSAAGRREVRRWRVRQSSIVYNEWSRFSEPSAISGLALTKAFVREGTCHSKCCPLSHHTCLRVLQHLSRQVLMSGRCRRSDLWCACEIARARAWRDGPVIVQYNGRDAFRLPRMPVGVYFDDGEDP